MQLLRFISRRLIFQVFVLLGLTLLTFSLMFLLPGDPAVALLTLQGVAPDRDTIAAFNERWGLDRPLHEQYLVFLRNVLRGDLGQSMVTRRPIAVELLNYFPATVELALAATVVAVALGVPMGILAAVHRDSALDQGIRVLSLFGVSMPIFWLAILALTLFYGQLGLVPSSQRIPITLTPPPAVTYLYTIDYLLAGDVRGFLSALHHLALPALLLGYSVVGLITRITRANMLDVLSQEYIRTARAKGLGDRLVLYRHALRNAMIPTVTALGLTITSLLSGAVLTETIFAWPGLGRFAVQSIFYLDRASVMGITLLIGVVVSVVNLCIDVLVAALDPRIHYG